jgi:hypothetical protein
MWDIDELQAKIPKIYCDKDYMPVEDLKSMTTEAHNVGTPEVYSGKGP